jgi:hypothetical protein
MLDGDWSSDVCSSDLKADAIAFAWEFLTRDLGLDRARLTATVYTDDDDAFALWKKVAGFGDDRVMRLGEQDNFWAMATPVPVGRARRSTSTRATTCPAPRRRAGAPASGPRASATAGSRSGTSSSCSSTATRPAR